MTYQLEKQFPSPTGATYYEFATFKNIELSDAFSFRPLQGLPIMNQENGGYNNLSNRIGFRPLQGLPIMNCVDNLLNDFRNYLLSFRPLQGLPIMNFS